MGACQPKTQGRLSTTGRGNIVYVYCRVYNSGMIRQPPKLGGDRTGPSSNDSGR